MTDKQLANDIREIMTDLKYLQSECPINSYDHTLYHGELLALQWVLEKIE